MSESGFPDFLEFSSVNLTNIAGIVHCCGKIPADRKSFEIIKTLAIRRLRFLFFIALFLVSSDMRYARKVKLAFIVSTISR